MNNLNHFLQLVLAEDVGDGDHTTLATVPANLKGKARLIIKENGIIAGVEVARELFRLFDPEVTFEAFISDGQAVQKGDKAFIVHGKMRSLLTLERTVLNIMQRMSGIATQTNDICNIIKDTHARLLDTRKTTPLMRMLEKEAVRIGGGSNHRFGLYDMIMIKDNHSDFAGGILNAIERVQHYLKENNLNLKIEVEVRNLDELSKVLSVGGIHRIMLDNFSPAQVSKAIELINNRYETEASGGITRENILEYALTGVDYISVGALTHSVKSLDMSLKAFAEND
jgi:nicotinate-nucleotide pyrophosphorylase (carboxylating)